jgi:head-tail adaptor
MADPDPRRVQIGKLRWPVIIAQRDQTAVAGGGMQEQLTEIITVRADVQPVGPMTFYGSAQVDTPVTHKVTVRWLDWLDATHVIIRDTARPDRTIRREVFRIRRVMELDGRKRFALMECELEKRI